jgi:hypothetical protein
MSSSIDYFECPKCGRQASREQDNRTCEIHVSCKCGYNGDDSSGPKTYNKITTGYVIQKYVQKKNDQFVCVSQEFIAGDEVTREDTETGESVDDEIDDALEVYFGMDMEQPDEFEG